jgi:hypothetical protein
VRLKEIILSIGQLRCLQFVLPHLLVPLPLELGLEVNTHSLTLLVQLLLDFTLIGLQTFQNLPVQLRPLLLVLVILQVCFEEPDLVVDVT